VPKGAFAALTTAAGSKNSGLAASAARALASLAFFEEHETAVIESAGQVLVSLLSSNVDEVVEAAALALRNASVAGALFFATSSST
jgi:hypothetical protein